MGGSGSWGTLLKLSVIFVYRQVEGDEGDNQRQLVVIRAVARKKNKQKKTMTEIMSVVKFSYI